MIPILYTIFLSHHMVSRICFKHDLFQEGVSVSKSTFRPSGDGLDLWNQLSKDEGLSLKLEQKKTSGISLLIHLFYAF